MVGYTRRTNTCIVSLEPNKHTKLFDNIEASAVPKGVFRGCSKLLLSRWERFMPIATFWISGLETISAFLAGFLLQSKNKNILVAYARRTLNCFVLVERKKQIRKLFDMIEASTVPKGVFRGGSKGLDWRWECFMPIGTFWISWQESIFGFVAVLLQNK